MSGKKSRYFKPFIQQPRTAPSNLNVATSSTRAARRAERHAQREADRANGERLMEREDLDVRGRELYSVTALRQMDTAMRLWCEFHQLVLARNDGPDYFTEGGPLPDRLTLHRYFFYLADALKGNLATSSHEPSMVTDTDRVTLTTMLQHLGYLSRAFSYYNKRLDLELYKSTKLWIKGDLAFIQELNREVKQKKAVQYSDVRQVIGAIWRFDSLSVLHSILNMFQMTLLLNLLVDGASRVGEFVPDGDGNVVSGSFLQWGDISFYIFPGEGADPVTIYAVILCRWLKGSGTDPTKHKEFIVRLLQPHLVFEDSCRLLVILALQRGVFRDFRSWDELMSCEPHPSGSPILVKQSFKQEAVFIRISVRTRPANAVKSVSKADPWRYDNVREIAQYISRLAGFQYQFRIHDIRHGDAYLLFKHCKDRVEAGKLMGHVDGETLDRYLGKTSSTDVQAVARGLEPADLTIFRSVRLGQCDDAPVALPEDQLASIDTEPEFARLQAELDDFSAEMIKKYGSIQQLRAAAKQSDDHVAAQELRRHTNLYRRKDSLWRRFAELKFRAYREEAIMELSAAKPKLSTSAEVTGQAPSVPDSADQELDAIEESFGRLSREQATRLLQSGDGDKTDGSDNHCSSIWRKHGLWKQDLAKQHGSIGRGTTNLHMFSYEYVGLEKSFIQLTDEEYDPIHGEVASRVIALLDSEVYNKDLPRHWLNTEDPKKCIVCESELRPANAIMHVRQCLKKQAEKKGEELLMSAASFIPETCPWGQRKPCSVDLTSMTPKDWLLHQCAHVKNARLCCSVGECRQRFEVAEEFYVHI